MMKCSLRYLLLSVLVLIQANVAFGQWLPSNGNNELTTDSPYWEQLNEQYAIQALTISPNGFIFGGTDGFGIYISTDNGNSWFQSVSLLTSFPSASHIRSIVVNNSGYVFIGAFASGIYTSQLGYGLWSARNNGLTNNNIQTLAINSSGYLFAGTNSGIYISTDNGNNWTKTNFPNYIVTTLAINSSGEIYASTLNHYIYFSSDNGNNWMPLSSLPLTGPMYCLAINSTGKVFAGGGGGLYSTTNNGSNWTQCLTTAIWSLAISTSDYIFAGKLSAASVYISTDNGQNWNLENDGLAGSWLLSLAIDKSGYIFAGTDIGVFRSTTPSGITGISDGKNLSKTPKQFKLSQNFPNPFNPSTTIEYQVLEESYVTLKVLDILGQEVYILVNEEKPAGKYDVKFNAVNLSSGVYFYRINAQSEVSNKHFTKVGKMILMK